MTTGRELVKKAYIAAGIIGRNESLSADETNDGLAALNAMVSSWATESLLVYAHTWETFTLNSGQLLYTIGTGGDFNTARPVVISAAYVRLTPDTFDYPLTIVSDTDYFNFANAKTLQGTPQFLNYDNAFPVANIRIWPVPAQTYTLSILTEKPLTAFTLDDPINLPPGWERALRYNLAMELLPDFGQAAPAETVRIASQSLANIKRATNRVRSMDSQPSVGAGGYNVYRGW